VGAEVNVEYVWATSPPEALKHALSGEFDLIFADVNMNPKIPGDRRGIDDFIKPLAGKTKAPIICMSSDPTYRQHGYEAGAVDFLDKIALTTVGCEDLERIVKQHGQIK